MTWLYFVFVQSAFAFVGRTLILGKPRAAGCAFFSYPLHGLGAKKINDAEVLQVKLPMLFVRGTGDAMCKQEHFDALLPRLAAPAGVHSVEVTKDVL
jgi:predicted alpha/beta-hydrolase family hydrolase